MKYSIATIALGSLAFALFLAPASAQFQAASVGARPDAGPAARPDRVLQVGGTAPGAFSTIQAAVDAAPAGALILVGPGSFSGARIEGKSLRIQGTSPGAVHLTTQLRVLFLGADQEVQIGGLSFEEGFLVEGCIGEVGLADCDSISNDVLISEPPGVHFGNYPDCGIGIRRNEILFSAAVSLVDCTLWGRDGYQPLSCDGVPGEHALYAEDSRVTLYGTDLHGGDGSDAYGCHGAFAGAGGDGVLARGAATRVLSCGGVQTGGTGGDDFESNFNNGCPGLGFRALDGALVESCSAEYLSFSIAALANVGGLPTYEITGPPGAEVFLMTAPSRAWREFPASEGVLHLGLPLNVISLGIMPASGSITRPFPAPRPAWRGAFASVELQVYGRVAGQDRYSEPRTLQVTYQ